MTIDDMAKVLAGLGTAEERRDFLLMVADELPEPGAGELRELARREQCVEVEHLSDDLTPTRSDWNTLCPDTDPNESIYSSKLPQRWIEAMPLTPYPHDALNHPTTYRIYKTPKEAWAALLRAVEVLK